MTPRVAHGPTWLASDRRIPRYIARPVARFMEVEAAGGLVLLAATVVALVWANSPWSGAYESLWHTRLGIDLGSFRLEEQLGHWVNDGLMVLFFFVIGLEIKGELVSGQLSTLRDAALPAIGALGGMVVPALLFAAFNAGGPGASGWGIPMATDIAFAMGVLALLGDRVPSPLKVLLLGLAIADDVGAIVVIAVFYSSHIDARWLVAAVAGLLAIVVMRRWRIWYQPAYVVVGVAVWLCTLQSGIHATIAGVALGLLAPAKPLIPESEAARLPAALPGEADVTARTIRPVEFRLRETIPVAERLEHRLHPWTSYVVIPVFALANAGIAINAGAVRDAASSAIGLGVVVGLVVGKVVGITGAIWLAVRLGVGRLPDGVVNRHVVGLASLAGIGFTVSIFVTGLAFDDAGRQGEAKLGVLAASVLAAVLGSALLVRATAGTRAVDVERPEDATSAVEPVGPSRT
jgi:NhaA family Na+:H+ antiporter